MIAEDQLVVVVGGDERESNRGVEAEGTVVLHLDFKVDVVGTRVEELMPHALAERLAPDAVAALTATPTTNP